MSSRPLKMLMPKEHGSWGVLATASLLPPFALGVSGVALVLIPATMFLFFAKQPWSIVLRPKTRPAERRLALRYAAVCTAFGTMMGSAVLWYAHSAGVVTLAIAAGGLASAAALLEASGGLRGSFLARIAAIFGMLLLIPLQEWVHAGATTPQGWGLTLLATAFFVAGGLRVRSVIRERQSRRFRMISAGLSAGLFLAALAATLTGLLPPLAPAALLPGLVQALRILGRPDVPVVVSKVGRGEILQNAAFGLIAIAAYIA